MSKYNWLIPILAFAAGIVFSTEKVHAVRAVASIDPAHETSGQPDPLLHSSAFRVSFAKAEWVRPSHFADAPSILDDHFIAAFAPHHNDPELSELNLRVHG